MNVYTVECSVVKKCSGCQTEKPSSEFHVRRASKDGLNSICKPCNISKVKSRYDPVKKRSYDKEYRAANAERLRKRYLAYSRKNAAAAVLRAARWAKANPERAKAAQHASYRRNVALYRKRAAEWKRLNPGVVNAWTAKRRATQAEATPAWADLKAIARLYEQARREGKHVDHIVPLRGKLVCGLHCEANLQLLAPSENFSKNNRHWPDKP